MVVPTRRPEVGISVLPTSTERILGLLPDDALVLDVGGWAAPFNRATHVLDVMPYETRGGLVPGGYGPGPERFSEDTWVVRDMCDHEPWPWPDDYFDFSLCVTTLEDVRDPIWVCRELSRVSKAGYVEVPTVIAELVYGIAGAYVGHEHHRWLVEIEDGGLVFMHKPHSIHTDWRTRVPPRWAKEMTVEDHLQGLFWEGELPARERVVIGRYPVEELVEKVRERFQPSPAELRLKELRHAAAGLRERTAAPARRLAGRLLDGARRLKAQGG
jgi:hypothetical protein